MVLDVLVELDREQSGLKGIWGVNAIFKRGVVWSSVANCVWPAHGHEPAASASPPWLITVTTLQEISLIPDLGLIIPFRTGNQSATSSRSKCDSKASKV
jgi:hypothetical protein